MTAMRFVTCRRPQESQALSENPTTTQKAVVRITALSSADTVKRLSMMSPQYSAIWGTNGKHLDRRSAGSITAAWRHGSARPVEPQAMSNRPPLRFLKRNPEARRALRRDLSHFSPCKGGSDARWCADHVSGRYSHSLPDQPVADRRPRQADRACRCDHSRRDLVAEIYRGVLARSLAYKKAPANAGAFRSLSGVVLLQRPEPVVHIPVDLILGKTVALLQLAFELFTSAFDHVEIVVGEFAPLFLRGALELFPVPFDPVPIHRHLPLRLRRRLNRRTIRTFREELRHPVVDMPQSIRPIPPPPWLPGAAPSR